MPHVEALPPDALRWRCDPAQFDFETTEEVEDLEGILGQDRAVEAIEFGIRIARRGYNIYALGPKGTGKHEVVEGFARRQAEGEETPPDICYVYNFEDPKKPRLLLVPAGMAGGLKDDMDSLIEELTASIPAAFESEEFQARRQTINERFRDKQEEVFEQVQQAAREHDITILRTPSGVVLAPVRDDEIMLPEELKQLDPGEREDVEEHVRALQERFQRALQEAPVWERERRRRLKRLGEEVTRLAVAEPFGRLRDAYEGVEGVLAHLEALEADVIEHAQLFIEAYRAQESGTLEQIQEQAGSARQISAAFDAMDLEFRRYRVNILVDHAEDAGAPVVYEDDPTLDKLTGKVEYLAQFGALLTDFTLISAGALHRANGGYLLLDARKLLMHPLTWEQLKRTLQSGKIRVESARQILGLVQTATLEPEPLELDVKVVVLGDRRLYYLLSALDPEFDELFKVAADFNEEMDRDGHEIDEYARLVATVGREEELLALDRGAVAYVIERMARETGDKEKMSTHLETIKDLLREADHWARVDGAERVGRVHVRKATEAARRRAGRVRDRMLQKVARDTLLIDTKGRAVGQVNGLSVVKMANISFGRPHRITASVRVGEGEVVDIEREAELGGPIHSKGVMIIAGFLGSRFAQEHPLSLTAGVVFEQSYGGIDGDSASLAEICCILSALAQVPIEQRFAMTGSVNQHGLVQAIGGVNEKIEGFFDTCEEVGLTGEQGVLIPRSNVRHLMLREEVVQAVREGSFHIWPVRTVDEALSALTGMEAGERGPDGGYPSGSLNDRVARRLRRFSEHARAFREGFHD